MPVFTLVKCLLQDDLLGKSVYNIIHISDHVQFSNSLLSLGEFVCVFMVGGAVTLIDVSIICI